MSGHIQPGVELAEELKDSDARMAAEFARVAQSDLQFDHGRREWFVRDETTNIFRRDGSGAAARKLQTFVEDVMFERITQAGRGRDLDAARRVVRRDLSASSLRRNLELATTQQPLANDGTAWNLNSQALATVSGQLIDLSNGSVRPVEPNDRVTITTAVPFDASVRCDRWRRFIREIANDDAELETLIRRALGYTITADISEQVFFVNIGTGSNGKSTLQEQMAFILGSYARALPFSILRQDRDARGVQAELAQLPGVRFAPASEVSENVHVDEGRLKSFTGGDTVSAAHKFGRPFTFRPVFKLWLSLNHRPRVSDRSHGFWRRTVLIPFERTFDIDKTLEPQLRDEAPGILAWLVEAALEWRQHGLPRPAAAEVAKTDWRDSEDVIGQWAAFALVAAPAGRLGATTAYDAFVAWANAERMAERDRPGRRTFGEWMSEKFTKTRTKTGFVYAATLVQGEGLDRQSGNSPHACAREEGYRKPFTTIHPTPALQHPKEVRRAR